MRDSGGHLRRKQERRNETGGSLDRRGAQRRSECRLPAQLVALSVHSSLVFGA